MGQRANALEVLLAAAGIGVLGSAPSLRPTDLPPDRQAIARAIFSALGGTGFETVKGPDPWDITAGDGLVIELDEEHHFNRYRSVTLRHLASFGLPWAQAYEGYCVSKEHRCGRSHGWWSSPSAERSFGKSAQPGLLDGIGSARWKQRAFYDACKDLHPTARVSRVSIYDEIDGRPLGAILRRSQVAYAAAVRDHVLSRIKPT